MRARSPCGMLVVALWLAGCADAASDSRVAVSDSAGVEIVDARAPAEHGGMSLGEALVRVGGEAPPFSGVVGGALLSDGRIVVADGGSAALYYFSPGGDLLGSVGGPGDGPGEFRTIQAIGLLPDDTVWVHDFSHQRVTLISPRMRVEGVVSLAPRLGSGLAVGILPDGDMLLAESWSSTEIARADEPGLDRELAAYVRYTAEGILRDTVGLFPGREVWLRSEDGRGVMSSAPLGRRSVHAIWGPGFVVGDQVGRELRAFSGRGKLVRSVRWHGPSLRVDDELASAWRSARLEDVDAESRADVERDFARTPLPERRPAYDDLLATRDGGLWVGEFALPGEDPSRWLAFDAEGRWDAVVGMPDRFRPLFVTSERVLGVVRDALDIEWVELRRLEGGSG